MQTRSFSDRVRHALSFEIVGLAIFTPLATLAFDKPAMDMGVIGLISATVATLWNFVFNIGFDRAMIRLTGSAAKSLRVRIISHASARHASASSTRKSDVKQV